METKSYKFKETEINIVPIGDIHIGDKSFDTVSLVKLKSYIDYIKKNKHVYCFLMGDVMNCATSISPSSPFQQNMDLNQQIAEAVKLFSPIKHKILGAIDGNHEQRLEKFSGYSPTISLCERLGVHYFKNSAVLLLRLGCHGKTNTPRGSFVGYFHHTTGGGSTSGSKINRIDKLRQIICNCDFYAGAHNHMLGCVHTQIFRVNTTTEKVEALRQMIVDTGGYLNYDNSYAEEKMLQPVKIGSPNIKLFIKRGTDDELKKDIHVSL